MGIGSPTLRVLFLFFIGMFSLHLLLLTTILRAEDWSLSALPDAQFQWVNQKGEPMKKGFPAKAEWVTDPKTSNLPKLRVWIAMPKNYTYRSLQGEVSNIQENPKDSPFPLSKVQVFSFDAENSLTAVNVAYADSKNLKLETGLVVKALPQEMALNFSEMCDRAGIKFYKVATTKPLTFLYLKVFCREDKENLEILVQHSADVHSIETEVKGSVERGSRFVRMKFPKSMLPKETMPEVVKEAAKPQTVAQADGKTPVPTPTPTPTATPTPAAKPATPPAKAAPETVTLGKIRLLRKGTDAKAEFSIVYKMITESGLHFSVSLGPSYLKYSESLTGVRLTQIGLTGKFGVLYNFKNSKYSLGGNVFATIVPLTHSPSDVDPTRFWGLNLDAGRKLGMTWFGADWKFTTGMYFWGMMVPGNSYGLKLLVGPKAVLSYRKARPGSRMNMGYLKYAPVADNPTSLAPSNYEIAIGTGFQLNSGSSKRPLLLTFDIAMMSFKSKVIDNTAKLLSASSGLQMNF